LLVAVNVAASLSADAVYEYVTVTEHILPRGPRAVPEQVSAVIAKPGGEGAGDGAVTAIAILSTDVALVPEFVSVNVCATAPPFRIVPKSKVALGDHAIEGAFDTAALCVTGFG
jgi:hypothetical protein